MDGCFLLSGLERKLLCGDGAAGSHRGAERTEEEQRHQQLQRQSHIITAADHPLHPLQSEQSNERISSQEGDSYCITRACSLCPPLKLAIVTA